MGAPLLRHQADISPVVPMAIDRVDDASSVNNVSGETLTWFFLDTGVWTSATGEAAGTLVWGKLDFDGLLNSNNATVGSYNNTSFSFATATRFNVLKSVPENVFSAIQFLSPTDQATEMAKYLTTNGEYAIDHRRGQVWGLALATVVDDSVSYSYKAPVVGSGGPASNVNIEKYGGTATTLGQKTATGSLPVVLASDQVGQIGGGGAGGGNNTYSTEQGDFTATVTDATNNIVLNVDSIGGVALAENNFANGLLKVWDASTEEMVKIILDDFTWDSATKTLDTTNCTGAFTFATGDVVSLTLTGSDKMRDSSTDAQRTSPIRDISDQYTNDTFTLTDVPNATPDETTILDMDGYDGLSFHFEKTGGTDTFAITLFGSNEDVLSTSDWIDITQYGFTNAGGADAASYTADTIVSLKEGLNLKGVKVVVTTAGTADDADFQVFAKRWKK